jgi:hypothetical protein
MTGFSVSDTISYYIQGYSGSYSQTLPIAASEAVYTFWFDPYTSVKPLAEEPKVTLFPNPASDVVFIKGIDIKDTKNSYQIINIQGTTIEEGVLAESASINLPGNLTNGLYFIKIITSGKTHICKLYLQH